MQKIHDIATETMVLIDDLAAGEVQDKLKLNLSVIVAEAQSLADSFKLAVASRGKTDATSRDNAPQDIDALKMFLASDPENTVETANDPVYALPPGACECGKCGKILVPNSKDNCRC